MEIRLLRRDDDLLQISSIYEKSWKYAYRGIIPQAYLDSIPAGRWADGIRKADVDTLVMIENGCFIGTASFCKSRWAQYPDYGEIVSIYFLPEYIGRGYGQKLIQRCIAELRHRGYHNLLLWVLEENTRARRFYGKNGFRCADVRREDCIGGRTVKEVLYLCTLPDEVGC